MHKTIEQIILEIEKQWESMANAIKSEDQPGLYADDNIFF